TDHTPQRIRGAFPTLLDLSRDLGPRYTVFYNGAKCGASAPDHMHFQAGSRGFMPIDREYPSLKTSLAETLVERGGLSVYAVENYLRRFVSMESADRDILVRTFESVMEALGESVSEGGEPMMNILSLHDEKWRVVIFPRAKHRPSFYYEEEEEKRILLSPAAVDLGGVCITPLEEDFRKITRGDIVAMYDEVCLYRQGFARLKQDLRDTLLA
ncbi:MAG: DUF4922 domain-containing protein, partial [Bacteroidetes bacterium]|nr:DUF4922 domain-containing protein [Bacteroidota bacterium]